MVSYAISTVFQLYHGGQFYLWRKPEDPEKTTDLFATHLQTLSHNVVSSAPHHAKSEIRTRNVIGDRLPYDHNHDDHFA